MNGALVDLKGERWEASGSYVGTNSELIRCFEDADGFVVHAADFTANLIDRASARKLLSEVVFEREFGSYWALVYRRGEESLLMFDEIH